MLNQKYSEALEKVKEFEALFQQAQEKIKALEVELVDEKDAVSTTENLLRKKNEEIRMKRL